MKRRNFLKAALALSSLPVLAKVNIEPETSLNDKVKVTIKNHSTGYYESMLPKGSIFIEKEGDLNINLKDGGSVLFVNVPMGFLPINGEIIKKGTTAKYAVI